MIQLVDDDWMSDSLPEEFSVTQLEFEFAENSHGVDGVAPLVPFHRLNEASKAHLTKLRAYYEARDLDRCVTDAIASVSKHTGLSETELRALIVGIDTSLRNIFTNAFLALHHETSDFRRPLNLVEVSSLGLLGHEMAHHVRRANFRGASRTQMARAVYQLAQTGIVLVGHFATLPREEITQALTKTGNFGQPGQITSNFERVLRSLGLGFGMCAPGSEWARIDGTVKEIAATPQLSTIRFLHQKHPRG